MKTHNFATDRAPDLFRGRTGTTNAGVGTILGSAITGNPTTAGDTLVYDPVTDAWVIVNSSTFGVPLTVEDEGTPLTTSADTLNFVGSGVTATGAGGTKTITISGSSSRPPFDYVVAPSDSSAAMQAIADAVCDGTADEAEINVAIAAAVTAARPYSILLLPGTYYADAKIDFTSLTSMNGKWVLFEASGTTIIARSSMTTMIDLAPGSGGQIVTCLDLRLGKLSGNATGGKSVTQIVNMARFNDNLVRVEQIVDGTGVGFKVSQSGVSDYPCGNNTIDIEIIHTLSGNAMTVTGGTGAYGFQGNSVHVGEIIGCDNGILLGASANQDATYNSFYLGIVEHVTNAAITDYCGANTWIVGGMNTNGKHLAGPTGMSLISTFIVTIDTATAGTIDAAVLDQHYVLLNGQMYGRLFMAARSSTPATPGSGIGSIYFKSDGFLYSLNDAGTETQLGGTSALTGIDFLVGTATGSLSAEIVVGTTPGGELGGTWPSPTVDATHSGSSHADAIATAEAYTDAALAALSVAGLHAHVAGETHLSDGSTTTYTLDQQFEPGSVEAFNTTTLAYLVVTEAQPDQATVSAAGSSGDKITFSYAATVA